MLPGRLLFITMTLVATLGCGDQSAESTGSDAEDSPSLARSAPEAFRHWEQIERSAGDGTTAIELDPIEVTDAIRSATELVLRVRISADDPNGYLAVIPMPSEGDDEFYFTNNVSMLIQSGDQPNAADYYLVLPSQAIRHASTLVLYYEPRDSTKPVIEQHAAYSRRHGRFQALTPPMQTAAAPAEQWVPVGIGNPVAYAEDLLFQFRGEGDFSLDGKVTNADGSIAHEYRPWIANVDPHGDGLAICRVPCADLGEDRLLSIQVHPGHSTNVETED